MNRNLLLTVAAAACLTWPVAALADPPDDHGGGRDAQDQGRHGGDKGHGGGDKADKPAEGASPGRGPQAATGGQPQGKADHGPAIAQVVPGAPASAQVPDVARHVELSGPNHVDRQPRVMHPPVQSQPPGGQAFGRARSGRDAQSRPAFVAGPAPERQGLVGARQAFVRQPTRPANVQVLAGWNRPAPGRAREQAGQQWRQSHNSWDDGARWRGNQNWWRGDPGFRLFAGVRIGFFFVPELGYVSAPAQYRSRHWRAGDELPNWFWRYQIRDFWNYGLPQPPDGCVWVWVNNDVALMDASDGYILDIHHNAW